MARVLIAIAFCFIVAVVALAEVRAKTLGGIVSDASGTVVENAEVTLRMYDPSHQETSKMSTRTDETGHYVFRNVEASGISLSVTNSDITPKKQTFTTKRNTGDVLVIDIAIE